MSPLTKVFAILVSVLAIFLCGVIVTQQASSVNWKERYLLESTRTEAANITALAAQDTAAKEIQAQENVIIKLRDQIATLQILLNDRTRELTDALFGSETKINMADTSLRLSQSLQSTIDNMQTAQDEQWKALNAARARTITAETRAVDLTRKLEIAQAKARQLEDQRRRSVEKNAELQNIVDNLTQQIAEVKLRDSKFRGEGSLTMVQPGHGGVPIRGEITDIKGDMAQISVGSSSGVRKGMAFWITRGSTSPVWRRSPRTSGPWKR